MQPLLILPPPQGARLPNLLTTSLSSPSTFLLQRFVQYWLFFNERGDFYAIACFLMMITHHPPERLSGLDFYSWSVDCHPGRWVAGTRARGDRGEGGSFSSTNGWGEVAEYGQGRQASSSPPTSSVSTKDEIENLCWWHENLLRLQKLHTNCVCQQWWYSVAHFWDPTIN